MSGNADESTPSLPERTRPLKLSYSNIEHTIWVPWSSHHTAIGLQTDFSRAVENRPSDESPQSAFELCALFLGHIAQRIQDEVGPETTRQREILVAALEQFEDNFLKEDEVHTVAMQLSSKTNAARIIQAHCLATHTAEKPSSARRSALMEAALEGRVRLGALFGGQGNVADYFAELRTIFTLYSPLVAPFLTVAAKHLQQLARAHNAACNFFAHGMDIMSWIADPETQPSLDYMLSAPVSVPVIALTQLTHYLMCVKTLGMQPGTLRECFVEALGHSQGIIVAVAVAVASDWSSFEESALDALSILFHIGVRSQEGYKMPSISPRVIADALEHGEGSPHPSLSVRGLSRSALTDHIRAINQHLPPREHIFIALVNRSTNIVVNGLPSALHSLCARIRTHHESVQRSSEVLLGFLPITAPFHCPHLSDAVTRIRDDLRNIRIPAAKLALPVYNTFTGQDIREGLNSDEDIIPGLIEMLCVQPVFWDQVIGSSNATHILDFGPGGAAGIGGLTSRMLEGSGARVILSDHLGGKNSEMGYRPEVFAWKPQHVKHNINWAHRFGPKLARTAGDRLMLCTRMTAALGGIRPIIVGGMTPTTVPWDFVAATINAGYEMELAAGGYVNAKSLHLAISKIVCAIPRGRGIVLNLIYASPKAIAWQIPLVRDLCSEGVPLKGITIGGGVPSLEVANEYIRTLGIRQIGFKPANKNAIQQVIAIADANPQFPVILQWTGGRGGGHHSEEDFHDTMLAMYSKIRQRQNIILVAGSGFGDMPGSYPYLSGTWSRQFGIELPLMPFDGILLASRCMVAKEAHTSLAAKQAIVNSVGLSDHEWRQTMGNLTGAGGVITVRSEMGEPIHKLATRGVLLWAEMDKTIFSLPQETRLHHLQKKDVHDYIIKRLHDDYQKPWFGCTSENKLVDLCEMTFQEVVRRMVNLMYIQDQHRWIDDSYIVLIRDFMLWVERRCSDDSDKESAVDLAKLTSDPFSALGDFQSAHVEIKWKLLTTRDCQQFLQFCKRPGQKPVPFVPALDKDFEVWFKKDSLWQSQDIDAVMGKDVGRVCILHGPVAAKYSTSITESIGEILDGIHNAYVDKIRDDIYMNETSSISDLEQLLDPIAFKPCKTPRTSHEGIAIIQNSQGITYSVSATPVDKMPSAHDWIKLLAGRSGSWRHTFLSTDTFIQGQNYMRNPMARIIIPRPGMQVVIKHPHDDSKTMIEIGEVLQGDFVVTIRIEPISRGIITMKLVHHDTALNQPADLLLSYRYQRDPGCVSIHEITTDRSKRIAQFYSAAWLGKAKPARRSLFSHFCEDPVIVEGSKIQAFTKAVGNHSRTYMDDKGFECFAPMDFAMVVGWKALVAPLVEALDDDILRLVHLSNALHIMPGVGPLKKGDVISAVSEITGVTIEESGKVVEVSVSLARQDGEKVMQMNSRFLYRGPYNDYGQTFERKVEEPFLVHLGTMKDIAVLEAKDWFQTKGLERNLVGKDVIFKLRTSTSFNSEGKVASIDTSGIVEIQGSLGSEQVCLGMVGYKSRLSQGNPVLDYLRRTGSELNRKVMLDRPLPLSYEIREPLMIEVPKSNLEYSRASGDFNPLHTSPVFASYVGLPGTITHGMFTSAAIRSLLETWIDDPRPAHSMQDYRVKFVGMVLPGDRLEVRFTHVGMISGRKLIRIEAKNVATENVVLTGEAIVSQPAAVYVFTGQGSQVQSMGMELYERSPVARDIWERAENHLLRTYGFSILDIVRRNPKKLTVHFGGASGQSIRDTYLSLTRESLYSQGLFKDITEDSTSYTFNAPNGLLSATQFAQPALTVMQVAAFQHSRSCGVIQENGLFAGHSLGEYSALGATNLMEIETLVSIVFIRGLCMQAAVTRDEAGRSDFSMSAVDLTRMGTCFSDDTLKQIVHSIVHISDTFLQIVNYNVPRSQYVCAGQLRGLDILANVTAEIKMRRMDLKTLEHDKEALNEIVEIAARKTDAKQRPLVLSQSIATTPLHNIDVPFHSSKLSFYINAFRSVLLEHITAEHVDPWKLVGKYIPNVTGRPFEISRTYFDHVYKLTKSSRIQDVIRDWDKRSSAVEDSAHQCI